MEKHGQVDQVSLYMAVPGAQGCEDGDRMRTRLR